MKDNSEAATKAFNLEAYDRLIESPYVDQKAVTQDFLIDTFAKGRADRYMLKNNSIMPLGSDGTGEETAPVASPTGARRTVIPTGNRAGGAVMR
jgi:hypothetical protein